MMTQNAFSKETDFRLYKFATLQYFPRRLACREHKQISCKIEPNSSSLKDIG